MVIGTVTVCSGSSERVTTTAALPPSAAVYAAAPKLTVTAVGLSSSLIETVVSSGVPAVTPVGSVPKARSTDSPSSSIVSAVAVNVNVAEVSVALNVTLEGTPL